MEFDSEGRIILPGNIKEEIDKEKRGIILTKSQISARSPAIAQLKITIGDRVENPRSLMFEMKRFCDAYSRLNFDDVDKDVTRSENYICVAAKSSFRMYSFLAGLIGGIRERFRNYPVAINGAWEKGF